MVPIVVRRALVFVSDKSDCKWVWGNLINSMRTQFSSSRSSSVRNCQTITKVCLNLADLVGRTCTVKPIPWVHPNLLYSIGGRLGFVAVVVAPNLLWLMCAAIEWELSLGGMVLCSSSSDVRFHVFNILISLFDEIMQAQRLGHIATGSERKDRASIWVRSFSKRKWIQFYFSCSQSMLFI